MILSRRDSVVVISLAIVYVAGVIGHLLPFLRDWMILLTPWTLVLCGAAVIIPVLLERNLKVALWLVLAGISTFVLEAVGTGTGAIFGPYKYGITLGAGLFGVPFVIAFNWLLVILGALGLAGLLTRNRFLMALIAALLAAGFDWILEPVAVRLDYWSWATINGPSAVPLRNYAAWFVIALAAGLFWTFGRLSFRSRIPLASFVLQMVFFTILRFFLPPH
jgi:putative membrane protein